MTSDRGRSIIFYPRSYNTRGESKKHSMLGVTSTGELINVKLRLDSKHEGKENAPAIKEFAKTDFLAKNPCIASDSNSPEKPEGILLLSKCTREGLDADKSIEVYTARWAVVLTPSSQSPSPEYGLGRMEIKKDSPTVKKLTSLMKKSEYDNRTKDADAFKEQINDPKSWSFPAIFYFPEKMVSLKLGSYDDLRSKLADTISSFTKSGIAGGFAIRGRNKSNEVVKETYEEKFSRFIISEGRYQNGSEAVESLISYLEERYEDSEYRWDIIPIKKINTGPSSGRYYGGEDRLKFTRTMFTFDTDDEPRLSKICVRVSYNGDTDSTLLSRIYATSEPLDHPARLDRNGHFNLTFTGEGTKLAHLPGDDEDVAEIPDGIGKDERIIERALWLLEGDVPILRLDTSEEPSPAPDSTENVTSEEVDNEEPKENQSTESLDEVEKDETTELEDTTPGSSPDENDSDPGKEDSELTDAPQEELESESESESESELDNGDSDFVLNPIDDANVTDIEEERSESFEAIATDDDSEVASEKADSIKVEAPKTQEVGEYAPEEAEDTSLSDGTSQAETTEGKSNLEVNPKKQKAETEALSTEKPKEIRAQAKEKPLRGMAAAILKKKK